MTYVVLGGALNSSHSLVYPAVSLYQDLSAGIRFLHHSTTFHDSRTIQHKLKTVVTHQAITKISTCFCDCLGCKNEL